MKTYCVAILGATGAVGRQMLQVLQERNFPIRRLKALASSRSAGSSVMFRGEEISVEAVSVEAFSDVDIVLGATGNAVAKQWAPAIAASGAVFIDNSSAFRLDSRVPLVVPEINGNDAAAHSGLIANPNCTTILSLTAVGGLRQLGNLLSMTASTYQAASGAGAAGPTELAQQIRAMGNGEAPHCQVFAHPLAYNVIPQIGNHQELGYTSEEMKLQYEGRKILHQPLLTASCTCVRVPVMRSHSVSLRITFDRPVSITQARQAIAAAPGCRLVDDLEHFQYPMPLDASDQDLVLVGRLRPDLTDPNSLHLWCCGDQLRKGAATNAVQIAELLIQ